MKNSELMRCKNIILKDTFGQVSSVEKLLKSELCAVLKKYCDFEDKNVYFEMFENRGKIYLRYEVSLEGMKNTLR